MYKFIFALTLAALGAPTAAHAGCSSFDLGVYNGWQNTGGLKGTVRLGTNSLMTASDDQRLCVQFTTDSMKVFWGQWKCDEGEDRFEWIQTLSTSPSAQLCDKTYTGGRYKAN